MASNLVDGDTNGTWDVFVYDRQTGETTRASVASDGAQGNYESTEASISSDGSYIGFYSVATNLVVSDTNGVSDIFVHDQQTGETTRVSIASDGTQGDGNSSYSCISGDGRFVTFGSYATNLVSGDTNGFMDVFVHERGSVGTTYTISGRIIDTDGNPIPDVIVSASPLYSGVTDIQGYYIISDVITGTYTVTPTLIAYTFAPPSLTVSVPPDSVEQNFLGYMMQYIFLPFIGLH
jgi:Tol biopolymer transport system component